MHLLSILLKRVAFYVFLSGGICLFIFSKIALHFIPLSLKKALLNSCEANIYWVTRNHLNKFVVV